MALLDGGAVKLGGNGTSVLKNPTILVVQDFLMVLARRVSAAHRSKFKLPGQRRGGGKGGNPRIVESTLVSAWVPLEALLANDDLEQPGDQEELALQFNAVANQGGGKQYPCIPDGSESPKVTELAMGPEEPRLFSLNGSKFLLDVRPPMSSKPGASCADFCGRLQPYLTPIDEGALSRQQLQLRKSQRLLLVGRSCEQGASESTWAPLVQRDTTLYMSRHIGKTHEVLSIVPPLAPNDFYPGEQQVPPAPSTAPTDHFATALALEGIDLRGGSPFVPIDHPVRGPQASRSPRPARRPQPSFVCAATARAVLTLQQPKLSSALQ